MKLKLTKTKQGFFLKFYLKIIQVGKENKMSDYILTTKQLAERWECSEQAIRELIASKKIKPLENLPKYRFSVNYIEEIEKAQCDPLSAVEKRRLLNKIEGLEKAIKEKDRQLESIQQILTIGGNEYAGIL